VWLRTEFFARRDRARSTDQSKAAEKVRYRAFNTVVFALDSTLADYRLPEGPGLESAPLHQLSDAAPGKLRRLLNALGGRRILLPKWLCLIFGPGTDH
jgi:hypothetical protein